MVASRTHGPCGEALASRIDAWLPQTQCTRCGYPRCRAYAEAVSRGEVEINRCPPGGATTLRALAALTGSTATTLDPQCGAPTPRTLARISESRCIGCTLCIQACPVDAIVGAAKLMHTVISAECTGCELCLPPCPVDCIDLEPVQPDAACSPWPDYDAEEVSRWRWRSEARLARPPLGRRDARARVVVEASEGQQPAPPIDGGRQRIRAELGAAIGRARRRRAERRREAGAGERRD